MPPKISSFRQWHLIVGQSTPTQGNIFFLLHKDAFSAGPGVCRLQRRLHSGSDSSDLIRTTIFCHRQWFMQCITADQSSEKKCPHVIFNNGSSVSHPSQDSRTIAEEVVIRLSQSEVRQGQRKTLSTGSFKKNHSRYGCLQAELM